MRHNDRKKKKKKKSEAYARLGGGGGGGVVHAYDEGIKMHINPRDPDAREAKSMWDKKDRIESFQRSGNLCVPCVSRISVDLTWLWPGKKKRERERENRIRHVDEMFPFGILWFTFKGSLRFRFCACWFGRIWREIGWFIHECPASLTGKRILSTSRIFPLRFLSLFPPKGFIIFIF